MTRTPYLGLAVVPIMAALLLAIPLAADALRLAAIKDPIVAKECSACHMLYPAGLLPARSWSTIIAELADHFGDNAELDATTAQRVADYLAANAADRMGISSKVLRGLDPALVPKRITELPWWPRKHEKKGRVGAVELARRAPSSRVTAGRATRMPNAVFSTMMSELLISSAAEQDRVSSRTQTEIRIANLCPQNSTGQI